MVSSLSVALSAQGSLLSIKHKTAAQASLALAKKEVADHRSAASTRSLAVLRLFAERRVNASVWKSL
jgi:hypothetical protein